MSLLSSSFLSSISFSLTPQRLAHSLPAHMLQCAWQHEELGEHICVSGCVYAQHLSTVPLYERCCTFIYLLQSSWICLIAVFTAGIVFITLYTDTFLFSSRQTLLKFQPEHKHDAAQCVERRTAAECERRHGSKRSFFKCGQLSWARLIKQGSDTNGSRFQKLFPAWCFHGFCVYVFEKRLEGRKILGDKEVMSVCGRTETQGDAGRTQLGTWYFWTMPRSQAS